MTARPTTAPAVSASATMLARRKPRISPPEKFTAPGLAMISPVVLLGIILTEPLGLAQVPVPTLGMARAPR